MGVWFIFIYFVVFRDIFIVNWISTCCHMSKWQKHCSSFKKKRSNCLLLILFRIILPAMILAVYIIQFWQQTLLEQMSVENRSDVIVTARTRLCPILIQTNMADTYTHLLTYMYTHICTYLCVYINIHIHKQ